MVEAYFGARSKVVDELQGKCCQVVVPEHAFVGRVEFGNRLSTYLYLLALSYKQTFPGLVVGTFGVGTGAGISLVVTRGWAEGLAFVGFVLIIVWVWATSILLLRANRPV